MHVMAVVDGGSRDARTGLPVDAHVHFHRPELVEPTLESAVANFAAAGPAAAGLLGMLLLVESPGERIFERLDGGRFDRGWRFSGVDGEPETVLAESRGRKIAIVCGRQLRCELGLEVLAIGTTAHFPPDRPLQETIDHVRREGAIPVVPWGFGKWVGRAGSVVRRLFETGPPDSVFAGDNGGRMALLGAPRLLGTASRAGFRTLPGTDPFPFGKDYRRVGSFGFRAGVAGDTACPWRSLRQWLESDSGVPVAYGQAVNPLRFVVNQAWIQVHNRVLRKVAN